MKKSTRNFVIGFLLVILVVLRLMEGIPEGSKAWLTLIEGLIGVGALIWAVQLKRRGE